MDGYSYLKPIFLAIFAVCAPLFAQNDPIWRETLGGTIISGISAQTGTIVAVCEGGSVKAFGSNGKLYWNYKEKGRFLPFLARSRSGASYFARSNGDFIALNRAGTMQWRLKLRAPLAAAPVSGWDERIFIFLEKKILCHTASGNALWQCRIKSAPALDPVLDSEGGCVTVLKDKTLLRISPYGEVNERALYSVPSFVVPLKNSRTLLVYPDGRLELYDARGEAVGNLPHLGAAPLAAASQGALAAVQLASGELVILDGGTMTITGRVESRPGVGATGDRAQKIRIEFNESGSRIYVLSVSGAECFSKIGTPIWNRPVENASCTAAIDGGIVYSGGKDWILYAWKSEAGSVPDTRLNLPAAGSYRLAVPPSLQEWEIWAITRAGDWQAVVDGFVPLVEGGNIGVQEPEISRILVGVAGDASIAQSARIEAIRLLGFLGSTDTINFLIRLLQSEKRVSVRAELALSLGRIGGDPDGRTLTIFGRIIETARSSAEEPLVNAIAAAAGTICRFSGPVMAERGIKILVTIAGELPYKSAATRAKKELDALRWNR